MRWLRRFRKPVRPVVRLWHDGEMWKVAMYLPDGEVTWGAADQNTVCGLFFRDCAEQLGVELRELEVS